MWSSKGRCLELEWFDSIILKSWYCLYHNFVWGQLFSWNFFSYNIWCVSKQRGFLRGTLLRNHLADHTYWWMSRVELKVLCSFQQWHRICVDCTNSKSLSRKLAVPAYSTNGYWIICICTHIMILWGIAMPLMNFLLLYYYW